MTDRMQGCANSEPGTFNHECGKPATWIGHMRSDLTKTGVFFGRFCDRCKQHGYDARRVFKWEPKVPGALYLNEWL